ncbi:peptide chain release factor N(5)-glutamine methyltransferase [Ichthyenterobacterium sp. W332]|uniref:Release factor glutamine methyltransferase n=1 Tax=Microcosmobacter mediterraneus TaxID=3075607 RepID=A0ABU2YH80_9FLAO|nr:peptide chain release factor N(5)-glutamine methyltransferase [Ichthyenterobacterium sp. W332]MDT0557527.1 peptide chain release factor N(5)-glutamine methyltransferase [Ichthyenterobacterium sp. W332]
MILKILKRNCIEALVDLYPKEECEAFFYRLAEHILSMQRTDIALNGYVVVSGKKQEKFTEAIERLKTFEPIQYIIGSTAFFGLEFKVNTKVLIPRPETEELVDFIIKDSSVRATENPLRILDIGTGSGCISIALAKHLSKVNVFAVDVSEEALNLAKTNATLNDVDVRFLNVDILNDFTREDDFNELEFDVIVSNPPYVRESEKELMQPNVLNYEPHIALFVENNDPLLFYKAIIAFSQRFLAVKGILYFEINETLGKDMVKLLNDSGFGDIELKLDIFGKDRMIKAIKQ